MKRHLSLGETPVKQDRFDRNDVVHLRLQSGAGSQHSFLEKKMRTGRGSPHDHPETYNASSLRAAPGRASSGCRGVFPHSRGRAPVRGPQALPACQFGNGLSALFPPPNSLQQRERSDPMNSANETIQGIREKLNSIKDAVTVIEFK